MSRICRHFEECGGCSFQDIPYMEQLDNKKAALAQASRMEDPPVIGSPVLSGFRNKMEYSFEGSNLGLHARGSFDRVFDVKECPVFSEWVGGFLDRVRSFASGYGIPYYSRRNKKGVLRYLILRESKFTGRIMVILVVNGNDFSREKEWARMLEESGLDIASAVLARRHSSGDSSLTEDFDILFGEDSIEMKIKDIPFRISPFSFFQPNSYLIDRMYGVVEEKIAEGRILDLYTGIGTIAFFVSRHDRDITGVDNSRYNILNATENLKKINPPGTMRFIESTVKNFLSGTAGSYDYVILDPPRGGMSYRIWKHLGRINARNGRVKRILYISCSLWNLKKDLDYIRSDTAWRIKSVTGVDQFVHTPHLETVVEIEP
ncbi:MAG: class I SAM-dependent RNA methyltransferase [Elusimicrobia bacterium]|nr:class I SAM-dependent RNA methyltransferase [Elusimicrobiota bacterium]